MLATCRQPLDVPHSSYIGEQLTVVLMNNYFMFNVAYYHQVTGTAMGTKLAPSHATLFLTKFEEKPVYTYPLQPNYGIGLLITSYCGMMAWNPFRNS